MKHSRVIASCGMTAALSVVIMLLGSALGLGMYISPMLCGLCLMPIGQKFGTKHQWTLWAAVSIVCLLLVPSAEQNLMYLTFFGLYPLLLPHFRRLPRSLQWPCKLLYFNLVVVAVEALVILVLAPEAMSTPIALLMLAMGNAIFIMYDFILPRWEVLFRRLFGKLRQ